jgi:Ca2+-binding EF-hand superfamily protein
MFETADFDYYDTNRDGKVTRSELVDRPNRAFELMDKSKSCRLTATELTGGRVAMQAKPVEKSGPGPMGAPTPGGH